MYALYKPCSPRLARNADGTSQISNRCLLSGGMAIGTVDLLVMQHLKIVMDSDAA